MMIIVMILVMVTELVVMGVVDVSSGDGDEVQKVI